MLVHNGSHLNDEYYTCPPYYNYVLKNDINEPNPNKKIPIPDRWETEYKSSFKPHLAYVRNNQTNICGSNQSYTNYSNQDEYEEENEEYDNDNNDNNEEEGDYEYEENEYDREEGTQTDVNDQMNNDNESNDNDIYSDDFELSSSISQPKIIDFVKTQYRKATLNKTKSQEKNKPVKMRSSFSTQTVENNKKPQLKSDPLLNTNKTKSILTSKSEFRDKVDLRKMIDYPTSNPLKERAEKIKKYKESKVNKEKEKLKKVESKILNKSLGRSKPPHVTKNWKFQKKIEASEARENELKKKFNIDPPPPKKPLCIYGSGNVNPTHPSNLLKTFNANCPKDEVYNTAIITKQKRPPPELNNPHREDYLNLPNAENKIVFPEPYDMSKSMLEQYRKAEKLQAEMERKAKADRQNRKTKTSSSSTTANGNTKREGKSKFDVNDVLYDPEEDLNNFCLARDKICTYNTWYDDENMPLIKQMDDERKNMMEKIRQKYPLDKENKYINNNNLDKQTKEVLLQIPISLQKYISDQCTDCYYMPRAGLKTKRSESVAELFRLYD